MTCWLDFSYARLSADSKAKASLLLHEENPDFYLYPRVSIERLRHVPVSVGVLGVSLSGNLLDNNDMKQVLEIILAKYPSRLIVLDLSHNCLTDDFFTDYISGLIPDRVQYLDVTSNFIKYHPVTRGVPDVHLLKLIKARNRVMSMTDVSDAYRFLADSSCQLKLKFQNIVHGYCRHNIGNH